MRPVVDMSYLGLLLLLPCSTLAGGSVSVSIKDLGALAGLESLNIQGIYDHPVSETVTGKASYSFNKDRVIPASMGAATVTDTKFGTLTSTVSIDPQERSASVDATLHTEDYGTFSTSLKAKDQVDFLGPVRWTSKPLNFPFALKEPTPMVIGIVHDVKTKEGQLNFSAKLSDNLDGKIVLPSTGDPIATVIASHSPDMDSDIRASANVLDLLSSGVGKGSLGVSYRRDLDTVQGSSSRVTLEGKDTGDFAWSLSNTTKRMTLVLSGRGRLRLRGDDEGISSTVALRSSFRVF